jgi:ABC-type nitrate/sulfonate/bicarbonate transport system ATPase subunit
MHLDVSITQKSYRLAGGVLRKVFDNFALRLMAGSVVALIGPSGCGKSSLLRMIAGLDRDFLGAVDRPAGRIAMAFQEPWLLAWRNVEENLRLVAPELSSIDLRALLAAFELDGRGQDFPGQLSLGLARRVALARAFAVNPDLLLLDEPFASLDQGLHERLRGILSARIASRAMTVIIATHDVDDALLLADRIIFMGGAPARILASLDIDAPRETRGPLMPQLRARARRTQDGVALSRATTGDGDPV